MSAGGVPLHFFLVFNSRVRACRDTVVLKMEFYEVLPKFSSLVTFLLPDLRTFYQLTSLTVSELNAKKLLNSKLSNSTIARNSTSLI